MAGLNRKGGYMLSTILRTDPFHLHPHQGQCDSLVRDLASIPASPP